MLTLTSDGAAATVAQWQNALEAVTYFNSSDNPSSDARTVSYQVSDGATLDNFSNVATATVNVTPVDDAPTVALNPTYLNFDGSSELVGPAATTQVGNGADDGVTLAGWVNWNGAGDSTHAQVLFYNGNTSTSGDGLFGIATANGLEVYILAGGVTAQDTGIALTANQWHQLALTHVNGSFTLYVDAAASYSFNSGVNGIPGPGPDQMLIGGNNLGTENFHGAIADVSVWNVALAQSQVQALQNTTLAGNEQNLAAYYPLNDGSGTSAADLVNHAGDLALSGNPNWVVNGTQSWTETAIATQEDAATIITGLSVADLDAGSAQIEVTLSAAHGTLTLGSIDGLDPATSGNGTSTVTLFGSQATIDAALASGVIYGPTADYNGADNLHMVVSDQGASGTGGPKSATLDVPINVTAVNDAPTASAPATDYQTTAGTPIDLTSNELQVGDVDGNGGIETVTLSVGEGVLNVSTGANAVSVADGNGTSTVTLSGTVDDLNALLAGNNDGSIVYNDNAADPASSTTLTLTIDDNGNTGTGGYKSATATATIDIAPSGPPRPPSIGLGAGLSHNFATLEATGLTGSDAAGINDSGVVVGQGDLDSEHQRGWSYDGATYTLLQAFGAQDTSAHAINSLGEIVGDYSPVRSTPRYGFTDTNGSFATIQSDSAGGSSNANGINDAGAIVGSDYLHGNVRYAGYIDDNGTFTYLSVPGADIPGADTFANGINSVGQVVGSYNTNTTGSISHGFLYSNGAYTTIDDPLGVNGTFAAGINDFGQIVGWYLDANGVQHGYVDSGGVFTTIDDPLGVDGTIVQGINNLGQVVGYYRDTNGVSHGFETALPEFATLKNKPVTLTTLSVSDPSAGGNPITVTLGVSHGTLSLTSTTGLTTGGLGSGSVTLTGMVAAINTALASGLTYAPSDNYVGADTLSIIANDDGNNGTGIAQSVSQNVQIAIGQISDVNGITGPDGLGQIAGVNAIENGTANLDITAPTDFSGLLAGGDGLIAEQSTTGTGSITVNTSHQLTGTGTGSIGLLAQNLDAANANDINVSATGGVSGDEYAIQVVNHGNGSIRIHAAGALNATVLQGIRSQSFGTGSTAVLTDPGSTINSGGSGINVVNSDTAIAASAYSSLTVTAYGSITSGPTNNLSGSVPDGIVVGYFGSNGTANLNINGTVTVNNYANIDSSAAGNAVQGYNYGSGDVTVNEGAGTTVIGAVSGILAFGLGGGTGNVAVNVGQSATITGTSTYGIEAWNTNNGNVSVTTAAGDIINSGQIGIFARNASTTAATGDTIQVTAHGSITSNSIGGINAGYYPGTNTPEPNVAGDVIVQSDASITANGGGIGINAYNWGTGNVSVTAGAGSSITSSGIGINAGSSGTSVAAAESVRVTAHGTINSGQTGINAYYSNGGLNQPNSEIGGSIFVQSDATIVATTGFGIGAFNWGTGNVEIDAQHGSSITALANNTAAINGQALDGGDVRIITAGTVSGAQGISAIENGAGSVFIENDGQVSATAFVGIGVTQNATAPSASTTIINTGTVVVAANRPAIGVAENGGGTVTISNTGTIGSATVTSTSQAIAGFGTFVINNSNHGVIDGSVTAGNAGAFTGTLNNNAGATWLTPFVDDEGIITASGANSVITMAGAQAIFNVGNTTTGSLTLELGAALTGSLTIANVAGSHGTVIVTGSGTTLDTTSAQNQFQNIQIGVDGTASMTIADHAIVTTQTLQMALNHDAGVIDTLDISDATLNATSSFSVAGSGAAHATIENGGVVNTADLFVANINGSSGGVGDLTVTGAGSVVNATQFFGLGSANSAGTVTVANGGAIDIGLGTTSIANAIHIANNTSLQGAGTINANVVNDASVVANGDLHITGAVTGSGNFAIGAGSELELGSSAAATDNFMFQGTTGTLKLDDPSHFAALIQNFAGTDGLDLTGFDAASTHVTPTSSGGNTVLTITDATHTVANGNALQITLQGDYTSDSFASSDDGNGGAVIEIGATNVNHAPVFDTTSPITLLSVANENSFGPATGWGGRFVTFQASDSVPGQGNGNAAANIFLYDRSTHTYTDLSDAAHILNAPAGETYDNLPSIGSHYVAFQGDYPIQLSDGNGDTFTGSQSEIYVYDRNTGTTSLLTNFAAPSPGNPSTVETVNGSAPALAGGSPVIAYESGGSNDGKLHIQVANYFGLPPNSPTNAPDSAVLNDIASSDPSYNPNDPNSSSFGNTGSLYNPGLSGDGRYVAFWSTASSFTVNGAPVAVSNTTAGTGGFAQVYVYDRFLDKLQMVSVANDGTPGDGNSAALSLGDGHHNNNWAPALSADGRFVVFQSNADNLLGTGAGADSNGKTDIYLYDLQTQTIQRVSVAADGSQLNGDSFRPAISPDGHYISFATDATNLPGADGGVQTYVRALDPTTGLLSTGFVGTGNGFNGLGETLSTGATYASFGGVALGFDPDRNDGQLTAPGADLAIKFTSGPISDYNASAVTTLTLHVDHGSLATANGLSGLSIVGGNDGSHGTLEVAGSLDAINKALASGVIDTYSTSAGTDTLTETFSDPSNGTATRAGAFDIATAQFTGGGTSSGQKLDVFLSDGSATSGAVIEDQNIDQSGNVNASGKLAFSDADATNTHTVTTTLTSATTSTGHVFSQSELAALLADFTTTVTEPAGGNAGHVAWTIAVPNADLQSLPLGGTATLVYTLTLDDGRGGTATQDVTITAMGVNDPPAINWNPSPAATTVNAGVPLSIDIPAPTTGNLVSDIDAGANDLLKVSLFGGSAALALSQAALNSGIQLVDGNGGDGSLSFLGTLAQINAVLETPGFVTYTPTNNPAGPATSPGSFLVQIEDGHGSFVGRSLNLTINNTPASPSAPALTVPVASTVSDSLHGTILDSTKWSVDLPIVDNHASGPADASVTPTTDGVVLHDHGYLQSVAGFSPTAATPLGASFSFVLNSPDYVALTDRTDGATDPTYGSPADGISFMANWGPGLLITDNAGNVVTANADFSQGARYDVAITDDGSHQTFVVTDDSTHQVVGALSGNFADQSAGDLVTITDREANDDIHTSTIDSVSLTIGSALAATENSPVTLTGLSAVTTDPTGTLSLTITGFPPGTQFSTGTLGDPHNHGVLDTLVLDAGQIASLTANPLVLTPPANFFGNFTVTATATSTEPNSASASTTKTFDVDVAEVNQAPTASAPATHYQATAGSEISLNTGALQVGDADGGNGIETLTLAVGEGILNVTPVNNAVTVVGGNGSSTVTVNGTVSALDALLDGNGGSVTYNDTADSPSSSTTLTLTIDDNSSAGTGGDKAATASTIIDIAPSAPQGPTVSADDTVTIAPDNQLAPVFRNLVLSDASGTIDHAMITWSTPSGGALGGLTNTNNPAGITTDLVFNSDNQIIGYDYHGVASIADYLTVLGNLGFANTSNETGDTFTLTVNDGAQDSAPFTVNVNVAPTSDWYVWTGNGFDPSNWRDSGNWQHGPDQATGVPSNGAKVYVDVVASSDSGNISLDISDRSYQLSDLNIQTDSEVDIASNLSSSDNLTITGAFIDYGTITVTNATLNVFTDTSDLAFVGQDLEADQGGIIRIGSAIAPLTMYTLDSSTTIGAQGGGTLVFDHATVNGGIIQSIGSGSIVEFDAAILDHLDLNSPGDSGPFPFGFEVVQDSNGNNTVFDGTGADTNPSQAFMIEASATVNVDPGAVLELRGTVQDAGNIIVDGAIQGAVALIDGSVTLNGGGQVSLAGPQDSIEGNPAWGDDVLHNDLTINGNGGHIGDSGGVGNIDGGLHIVNEQDGIISANDPNFELSILTDFGPFSGRGTLVNYGLIVSTAERGLEIAGNAENDGAGWLNGAFHGLDASGGLLKVAGDLTGGGHALIDGGNMEFDGASDAQVAFATDSQDQLILGGNSHFTGSVTGFSFGDSIEMAVDPSQVVLGDHQVTYNGGTPFTIDSQYSMAAFILSSDGHGGSLLAFTDQAPVIDTSQFTLGNSGSSTTINGLSVSDSDTSPGEIYTVAAQSSGGGQLDPASGSGSLDDINGLFSSGVTYTAPQAPPLVDKITLTVTDGFNASATVNFIFQEGNAPNGQLTLDGTGTQGKDVIFASGNPDIMTGNGNGDQFVFQSGDPVGGFGNGNDVITNFQPGLDKIDLRFYSGAPRASDDFTAWLNAHATQQTNGAETDTKIDLDQNQTGTDTILLQKVALANLHASDFLLHS